MGSGISVFGEGVVSGPADMMTVELSISAVAGSVAQASATVSDVFRAVTAAAGADAGVAGLNTRRYSVHPEHRREGGPPHSFIVEHAVAITITDLDRAGEILAVTTEAGRDHLTIHATSMSLEASPARLAEARARAWEDALTKAQHLANLAGRTLGAASAIREHPPHGPPLPPAPMALEAAAVPLERAEAEVRTALDVRFEFAG